jgi:competence protein ComEA
MTLWMLENKKRIALGVAGIAAVIYFSFYSDIPKEKAPTENVKEEEWKQSDSKEETQNKVEEKVVTTVMVDIKGAVNKPGVYEGRVDERVKDLVARAGGLTDQADQNQVNFAAHVADEMVIYIPMIGEVNKEIVASLNSDQGNQGTSTDKVNLNSADESELQTLPGIGPSKAAAIIEFRNTSGPFKTIDDLKNISGIGEKTFEKLKDSILVQ